MKSKYHIHWTAYTNFKTLGQQGDINITVPGHDLDPRTRTHAQDRANSYLKKTYPTFASAMSVGQRIELIEEINDDA